MIKVKARTTYGKELEVEVNNGDTIDSLKSTIQSIAQIPQDKQKLLYNGKIVDSGTLSDVGFKNGGIGHFFDIVISNNIYNLMSNIKK